ncbi:MAG: peptidylprolyl isomerase [Candidatus Moranbacteria bacterium]|nr:peptidylprolyl isomerase [Candidatus Moranbacteria bacterium]
MEKQQKQTPEGEIKIKISTLVYAILIVLVVVVGILSILAYGTNTAIGSKISAKISQVIPFPAAIVDWRHVVFMKDVETNLASVEKFYQTKNFASEGLRVDFSTDEGKKRLRIKEREILDKMVEDQIIEILAKNRGISVSDSDAQKVVNQQLNEFGTADDVKKDLENSYGWNMDDFKARVVVPNLYADALASKVMAENFDVTPAKDKINKALKDLENGKDFAQVVRTYSEGTSKDNAGELGWVKKDQVLPELQAALFGDGSFKKDSIIESSIGFHLMEIEDSKKVDGEDQLKLRQVFVSKNTFADWLQNQKKQMQVTVPLKDFVWNKATGSIDFRDDSMRAFEKEQRAKSQGDASIML